MINSIYIYHHLGLGDVIICNAIVRSYAEKYDKVFVFSKPKNLNNTLWMYRDNPEIRIISMEDFEIKQFMKIGSQNNYLIIGHEELFKVLDKGAETFDQIFYRMANIPFEDKWNKFFIQRDLEKEKEAFYKLKLKDGEEYIFIHESPERKIYKNINSKIKKIFPDNMNLSLFDYLYIIEKAKEVHVMNSSFMNIIDCMQLKNTGLFYHEYARPGLNATLKLDWITYK